MSCRLQIWCIALIVGNPSGRGKNFPENGRVVGRMTLKIFGIWQALLNLVIKQQKLNVKNLSFYNTMQESRIQNSTNHFSGIMW